MDHRCPSCGSENVYRKTLLTEVPGSAPKMVLQCEDCQFHHVVEQKQNPQLLME